MNNRIIIPQPGHHATLEQWAEALVAALTQAVQPDTVVAERIAAGILGAAIILTGKLTLGNVTFGDNGIQLEYNNGNPRIYIGDGDAKYLQFDTTTGEVTLGRDTELAGADAYNNSAIYLSNFGCQLNWQESLTGGASLTYDYLKGAVVLNVGTASGDNATVSVGSNGSIGSYSWNSARRFKVYCERSSFAAASGRAWRVGIGDITATSTSPSIFIYGNSTGNIYGYVCDGTSCSNGTLVGGSGNVFEIVFTPGVDVKFYRGGVLARTLSTNLPSGTTNASIHAKASISQSSAQSFSAYIQIGEIRFLQDA